jgi:hypothetical protein
MISKSKLGAMALILAIGIASPAFAQYSPEQTGGGSPGYNIRASTPNWRLRHHVIRNHVVRQAPAHQLPSKAQ